MCKTRAHNVIFIAMQRNVRFMIVNANRFIGYGSGIGYFETCGLTIAKNRIKTALSIHIPYLTII